MFVRISKALPYLFLAPAILPLVYFGGILYPYVSPKTFLLRAFGLLLAAAVAYLACSGRPMFFERLKQKVTWIPATLLVVAYGTSLFSVDFYRSFWSVYDRGDGLLTLTVIVAFFYGILLYADRAFFDRMCRVITWVASLAAIYVILQWLQNLSGMNIPLITEQNGRFGGTLGNAAFLAAYLGMTFFITLIAAPQYRGKWQKAAYVGAGLQILAIFISATRGTILALVGAAGLTALYLAWKGEGRLRLMARIAVIAGLIGIGIFFAFRTQLANSPIDPIRRIASINLTEATVSSRLFVWSHMMDAAMHKPLLGYGAEHIDIPFNTFYDPDGIVEQWFDRSHNVYIDYMIQFGIFGLALYLALLGAFIFAAVRLMRNDAYVGGLLVLFVVTYAVQNFVVFDTSMSLWLLLVFFAFTLSLQSTAKETKLVSRPNSYLANGLGIAFVLALIPVFLLPLWANIALAQGYKYHVVDARRAVSYMEQGLSLGTYADLEYGYQAYQMYTDQQATMLTGESRIIAYRYAKDLLAKNYARYSYDARTATYYAHVLDQSPPEIPVEEEKLRSVIKHAQELSPKRIQPWYLLANISLRKADAMEKGAERDALYREGISVLEEYARLVPGFDEPRFAVATLYLTIGDMASAKEWADSALPLYAGESVVAKRAVRYYVAVEDWQNAIPFMKDILKDEPENYPVKYDLAKATFLNGDKDEAERLVNELRTQAPGLVETDPNFVKALEGN